MVLLLGVLLLPVVTWINLISMLFVTNYVSSAFSEVQTASLGMNFIYMALLPALSEEFIVPGRFFPRVTGGPAFLKRRSALDFASD